MTRAKKRVSKSKSVDIKKYLKDMLSMGWGMMKMAQEQVDDMVGRLEREGYLNRAEGKRLAKDLLKEANIWQKKFSQRIDSEVRKVTKGAKVAKKSTKKRR